MNGCEVRSYPQLTLHRYTIHGADSSTFIAVHKAFLRRLKEKEVVDSQISSFCPLCPMDWWAVKVIIELRLGV